MHTSTAYPTYQDVVDFIHEEADLLDAWKLNDWLALFDTSARYLVPTLETENLDPDASLYIVSDDYPTLKSRVAQLMGRSTWAETPRSRTRRLISNIRIDSRSDTEIAIKANFAVWRFQRAMTDVYVGEYRHTLLVADGALRFKERRAKMDLEALRPHGKLSIIL